MPFKKVGPNRYKGPSGRTFNKKQVALYYASDGFRHITSTTHPVKKSDVKRRKGK